MVRKIRKTTVISRQLKFVKIIKYGNTTNVFHHFNEKALPRF